jgi:ubiquinone/menaquinone biosynthesis C-methylase UbiE
MSSPTIWSSGRYESVAERIAPIAADVVAAVDRRRPVRDATVADLACGTGSAALAAAGMGARVTAVDITPELIAVGAQKAALAGRSVAWVTADAADTGLPAHSFDAVVSNMGIIFVEPSAQVAEFGRLLTPGGVLGFSSWVADPSNPFRSPIVAVLGPTQEGEYTPDQWGDPDTITTRLAADFDDVVIDNALHTWRFASVDAAVHFMTRESPMHVALLDNVDGAQRDQLRAAFDEVLRTHLTSDCVVSFDSPYLVVTARRR